MCVLCFVYFFFVEFVFIYIYIFDILCNSTKVVIVSVKYEEYYHYGSIETLIN